MGKREPHQGESQRPPRPAKKNRSAGPAGSASACDRSTQADKTYEPVTYEGAGHGFMRAGEAPDASPTNKKAREEAWGRWKELLKKL